MGEWLSLSDFDSHSPAFQSFDVLSVGIPVDWLHLVDPSWQTAVFAMPLGHKASLPNAPWAWEYMGGAFARYTQNDHLWWAFGFFTDVGPGQDTYLPYLGASWEIDDRWTLSAVMLWPAATAAGAVRRYGVTPG